MEKRKGKLVKKGKGLNVKDLDTEKRYALKKEFNTPENRAAFLDAECVFEIDGSNAVNLTVNGKPLQADQQKLREKEEKAELARKEQEEAEAAAKAEEERRKKAQEEAARRKAEGIRHADSFVLRLTRTPADTRAVAIRHPDNFALKYHKLARYDAQEQKFFFFQSGKKPGEGFSIEARFGAFEQEKVLAQLAERQTRQAQALCGKDGFRSDAFEPEWRLTVGLGQASVYETSLTLHHVYGLPYIPASAVKGIVRSWVVVELFDGKESKAIADQGFCDLFGCPADIDGQKSHYGEARKGYLTFFDAFPTRKPQVVPDVMNVHYKDYYGKADPKPPADWQEPNPVFFLTVEDTPFRFTVGKSRNAPETIKIKGLDELPTLAAADRLLKDALEKRGIGAKTAVGYGYMLAKG